MRQNQRAQDLLRSVKPGRPVSRRSSKQRVQIAADLLDDILVVVKKRRKMEMPVEKDKRRP